jgi:Tol biopolymer transport system component
MGNVLDDVKRWEITDYQDDRSPAWSPDDHRIVFQTKSHDHWEIVVINDDGQNRMQITRSWPLADVPVNSVAPAWSPDGQWIAYLTDERGKWELWRMRPDGSEKQPFLEDVLKDIPFEYHSVDERVVSWGK